MNCIYILPTPMYHCKIQQCLKKYLPPHDGTDKVGQNTWSKMTMHSAKGCCIATTMTLTSIKRKAIFLFLLCLQNSGVLKDLYMVNPLISAQASVQIPVIIKEHSSFTEKNRSRFGMYYQVFYIKLPINFLFN